MLYRRKAGRFDGLCRRIYIVHDTVKLSLKNERVFRIINVFEFAAGIE